MTEPAWRLPPIPVLLVGVALIACAELGGGAMAQFKLELARWARGTMLARPQVHGFVGVRDVDEQILDEALVKFDAGLRLFHLHAEGNGGRSSSWPRWWPRPSPPRRSRSASCPTR